MPDYMSRQSDKAEIHGVPMKKIRYGALGNVSANGCGAIALYNVLHHHGQTDTFEQVVGSLKKRMGFHLFGLAGTRFGAVKSILADRGFQVCDFRNGDPSLSSAFPSCS